MTRKNVKVGTIKEVSGEVSSAGGDIYKEYTATEVSQLLTPIIFTFQLKPFIGRILYKLCLTSDRPKSHS